MLSSNNSTPPIAISRNQEDPAAIMASVLAYTAPIHNFLLMISVLGNGLLVGSSRSLATPVSPYVKLCVSLAAADLCTSLHLSWKNILGYINFTMGNAKLTPCQFALNEALRLSSMLCSNWHLFVLALNHFLGTLWPLRHKVLVTRRRMRYVLINLWVLPHLIVFAWFLWSPVTDFRWSCELRFYFAFPLRATMFLLYSIPMIATVIMYVVIVRCLTKAQAKLVRRDLSSEDPLTRKSSSESIISKKMKLVWTSLIIVCSYCFSWGPHILFFMMVCPFGCPIIAYTEINYRTVAILSQIVQILVGLKMAGNLFIYTLRMDKFRQCIGNDLRKLKYITKSLQNLANKILLKHKAPDFEATSPRDSKSLSLQPILHKYYLEHD